MFSCQESQFTSITLHSSHRPASHHVQYFKFDYLIAFMHQMNNNNSQICDNTITSKCKLCNTSHTYLSHLGKGNMKLKKNKEKLKERRKMKKMNEEKEKGDTGGDGKG